MLPGGPSVAYVFGWVLLVLLLVEGVTGAALAAFYSPSTSQAWASVAYVQDQVALGWLVRGLHYHGASALVIVCGLHLTQTAVFGAYKAPRELNWWLGILLMMLVLAFAITGYVLRWDQAGYWANHVEVDIAAATPIIGNGLRSMVQGGNAYGNLTLTRFYMLHIVALPAIVGAIVVAHLWIARRLGSTPPASRTPDQLEAARVPRWPGQSLRNTIAMAVVVSALLAVVIQQHGADLAAPADPSTSYDARPLWYFRWLYELRHLAGSAEKLAALAAPAIVVGFLVALPRLDRDPDRSVWRRWPWVGGTLGLCALIIALTVMSFAADAGDAEHAKRERDADALAVRARHLAVKHGVPVTGGLDVYGTPPMYRARQLFTQRCAGCHVDDKQRKGPVIAPGHGDRAWLRGFLQAPSGDIYWGRTKLAHADAAMKPVELPRTDLDDLVEMLYAETGAADADAPAVARGTVLFDKACTGCHEREEENPGASAPSLYGLGSRTGYFAFIGNAGSPIHMGTNHEMPRFDHELTLDDRDALAEYLVWLRTATPQAVADLAAD
jgi:ubiquinol-cytochrome c reductase cytochrome b subunit